MTADTSVPSTALLTGADRDGSNYTARHLLVLEGLEAVRKRPGMYIGSTDSRGLMHCLWEIIDNSVDEALGGYCDHIEVILHDDNSVEVRDNGRGIPVDVEPKTGLSGVEVVMTKLHAAWKVRRRFLRRVRRSARRRRLRRQRALRPAGRRGRPQQRDALDQLPARSPGDLHRAGAGQPVRPGQRPAQGQAGTEDAHRHQGALLGGPADLPQGRQAQPGDALSAGTADGLPRSGAHDRRPRRTRARRRGQDRGDLPFRRRHQRILRVPRPGQGGLRRPAPDRTGHFQGDRAGPGRARSHDGDRGHA